MLSPPQSLASVPVVAGLQTSPRVAIAQESPRVSWSNNFLDNTIIPTNVEPHPHTSGLATAGVTLSPAAETFPRKLVDKIQSGQFAEMKELLTDNVSLLAQLEEVGVSAGHMLGQSRPRLREVSTLTTWCYCYLGYVALRTTDAYTRDQLAYARLLIREAQRHGGLGWLDYDKAFRQQAAADPSLKWNTLMPGLQASTILSQRPQSHGAFCTLC